MSNQELNQRDSLTKQKKYTSNQKLINSILEKVRESRIITQNDRQNREELYAFK